MTCRHLGDTATPCIVIPPKNVVDGSYNNVSRQMHDPARKLASDSCSDEAPTADSQLGVMTSLASAACAQEVLGYQPPASLSLPLEWLRKQQKDSDFVWPYKRWCDSVSIPSHFEDLF